jgi:hypothetical protein
MTNEFIILLHGNYLLNYTMLSSSWIKVHSYTDIRKINVIVLFIIKLRSVLYYEY